MSSFRNPVGPQSSSVYWRRRLVLGLGLLAVIVVVILVIVSPRGTPTTPQTSPPPATTAPSDEATDDPSDDETSEPTGEDAPACDPADIELTAGTDKDSYASGELPKVMLTVVNTGDVACEMSVGTDVQDYRITSGEDVIWDSQDCQTGAAAREQILEPGKEVSSTPFEWDRTRSDPDTCDDERPAVIAGGATYHLKVYIGEVSSDDTKRFLLY